LYLGCGGLLGQQCGGGQCADQGGANQHGFEHLSLLNGKVEFDSVPPARVSRQGSMPRPRLSAAGYCVDKSNQTDLKIYIIISSKSNALLRPLSSTEAFLYRSSPPTDVGYSRKFDPNRHLSAILAVEVPLPDARPDE
jgi:hypothetical protein